MPLDFAESPVVETTEGKVRGYVFRDINVYKGMNYGDTTAGANRFLPPKPPKAWTGIREAVDYGETTPQAPGGLAVGGPPTGAAATSWRVPATSNASATASSMARP